MEVLDRFKLDRKVETVKEDPVQRQILRIVLKYEMQSLRLAEIGEESVVVTASVVDGTHSVLASDQGERFLHDAVVTHFMDHFVTFLFTGESQCPVGELVSSSESCTFKHGSYGHDDDQSMSSAVSADEPETFMHMKKHQIEQFNRKKDHEDRAIDETVSKLVKNILKEGKEKEKKNISGPLRRKRGLSYNDSGYPIDFKGDICSQPKKKPIVQYFPTLSPMLSRTTTDNTPASYHPILQQSESKKYSESSDDEVVTIKIEAREIEDNGDSVHDTSVIDVGSQAMQNDYVVYIDSDCSNQERISWDKDVPKENLCSHRAKGSEECAVVQKTSGSVSDDSNNSGNMTNEQTDTDSPTGEVIHIKTEENIDLPFVEEYYNNRINYAERVKLTTEEKGRDSAVCSNISCYKQSRKKSNTFNLVLNGYLYIKDKQSSTGTIYWKCGRGGCKGRVIQRGQELIISQIHIHAPSH